jgi:hypothetical protein
MRFKKGYDEIIYKTANIHNPYSKFKKRYTIKDPNDLSQVTREKSDLEILIGRVNEFVIPCKTNRDTAREVFSTINQELRQYIENECTKKEQINASLFLLGALIHRFLRLKTEYKQINKYRSTLSYFGGESDINNCRLYQGVNQALEADKREIDNYTIYTSLLAFRKVMLSVVEVEKTVGSTKKTIRTLKYKTYEHFDKVDPNFEKNLDKLIKNYEVLAAEEIKQFNAIWFFESLPNQLEKDRIALELEIKQWCDALGRKYKELNKIEPEVIEQHLEQYFLEKIERISGKNDPLQSERAKEKAFSYNKIKEKIAFLANYILWSPQEWERITNSSVLALSLNEVDMGRIRCILCGGYSLLMNTGQVDQAPLYYIKEGLTLEEPLTQDEHCDCISMLNEYVMNEDSPPALNCDFFKDRHEMLTVIENMKVELNIAKEQRATELKDKEEADIEAFLVL